MKYLLLALSLALPFSAASKTGTTSFSAKSYLVADNYGMVLKEQESNTVRPIASISKLMVGMLAAEQDQTELLNIPATRTVQSSIPRKASSLSRKDLLTLALVRSDNFATQILCNNIPDCVPKMNERAALLGMHNTTFFEPTGLDKGNTSTANDLLKLLVASSMIEVVMRTSSMPKAEIYANGRVIRVNNTNPLTSGPNILLSKTGFTNPAGGCLVMVLNSLSGYRFLIVLGSKNSRTRIPDMEKLVKEL